MRAQAAQLLMERYLKEGGASGHLQHLYDNRDLTFADLKSVLSSAAQGKLTRVSEKLDGLNVVFTYSPTDGIKAARSGGDVKNGGMSAEQLAAKFQGRGNVADAFNGAFKVLADAVGALSDDIRSKVFANGRLWYSAEVVYTANPNVINYDNNYVVFHASPVFRVGKNGEVTKQDDAPGVSLLDRHVTTMQKALTQRSWQVRGPAVVRLQKISNGAVVSKALQAIEEAQHVGRCGDGDTLGKYIQNLVSDEVADLGLSPKIARAVVQRVVGVPGAPTLNDIKKMVPADQYATVSTFVKASPALLKKAIAPIEQAVHDFAVEVLRGLHSVLIGDHDKEVARLRGEVARAVKAIETSGNAAAMDVLKTQMQKLGSADNITSAIEGIVFTFKGQAYKFSGHFAPTNQILGLFKYGRGAAKVEQAELRVALNTLLERCSDSYLT